MKLAIITGGSKGLGAALVDLWKRHGYRIVEFSRTGATKDSVQCDFQDYHQSATIVSTTMKQLSDTEYSEVVLINNVGAILPIGPIGDFSIEDYQKSIHVNFLSTIMVSGVFTKYFQQHRCNKTIIYISSGAAIRPKYGWSLYCSAKAGLDQFFRTYALEQSPQKYPIRAVTCNPGVIDTDMQETIRNTPEELFPEKARFIGLKNNNELRSPEHVAAEIYQRCLNSTEDYVEV